MAETIDSFSYGKIFSFLCKIFSLFLPCSMAAVPNLYTACYMIILFYSVSIKISLLQFKTVLDQFFSLTCFVLYVGSFQVLINSLFFIVSHFIFFSEDSFPRLGSMIVDYENPLKKIAEQFVPHQQVGLFVLYAHEVLFFIVSTWCSVRQQNCNFSWNLVFNHKFTVGILQRNPLQFVLCDCLGECTCTCSSEKCCCW